MHTPHQTKILAQNRIRRIAKSPSFGLTGQGHYFITRNGKKVVINAKTQTQGTGGAYVEFKEGEKRVGIFVATKCVNDKWDIFHRQVLPELRGYNLGRVGFRLIEQHIRKQGGKKIKVETNQREVIQTLLKIGYSLKLEHKKELCACLNLSTHATTREIISALNGKWEEAPPKLELVRELK